MFELTLERFLLSKTSRFQIKIAFIIVNSLVGGRTFQIHLKLITIRPSLCCNKKTPPIKQQTKPKINLKNQLFNLLFIDLSKNERKLFLPGAMQKKVSHCLKQNIKESLQDQT